MKGFRSLSEDEEIEFESQPSDKGVEATFVCGVGGGDCHGSERRPASRKKFKKIRSVPVFGLGVFSMARRHALVLLRHAAPSSFYLIFFNFF